MTTYRLTWYVDVEADTPQEAAAEGLAMHRDPESTATIFTVRGPDGAVCIDAETQEEYPSDEGAWPFFGACVECGRALTGHAESCSRRPGQKALPL